MSEHQEPTSNKRTRIPKPYPRHTLDQVLVIARTIQDRNAGGPFDRIRLAEAIDTKPTSSAFMMKLTSSAKYGLSEGGYNDPRISLTPLGGAVTGKDPQERRLSLIQAAMCPATFRDFYKILDGKRIPNADEASGIIVDDLDVPEQHAAEFLSIAIANGTLVGIVTEVGGSKYVSLSELSDLAHELPDSGAAPEQVVPFRAAPVDLGPSRAETMPGEQRVGRRDEIGNGRVFIAHSGATRLAEAIVELLNDFGISNGVVDVDPLESSPLSLTATAEMDECSGAIIVFAASEQDPPDPELALSRGYKMLLHLGAALDRFRERVVQVVGPGLEPQGPTDEIPTIRIESGGIARFELDLLRELYRTKTIDVLVPRRES